MSTLDRRQLSTTIYVSFGVGVVLWFLQTVIDLASILSSCSLFFSRWVATEFRWFIICPEKAVYSYPGVVSWLFNAVLLMICIYCIINICHAVKLNNSVARLDTLFLCFSAFFLILFSVSLFQTRSAVRFYEQFSLIHFRVSEFDQIEARKFQIRMSKIESVPDIESALYEMRKYVDDQQATVHEN